MTLDPGQLRARSGRSSRWLEGAWAFEAQLRRALRALRAPLELAGSGLRTVSAVFPIALFILVGAIWASAVAVNSRLLALFLKRTGDAADVPSVLRDPGRHPEKLVYFFRHSTLSRLKAESDLWRLRQLLRVLLLLSVAAPVLGFGLLSLAALLLARLT